MAMGRYQMGISEDAGKTFKLFEENESLWHPADYPFEHRREHPSGGKGKLYKSIDGGETWKVLGAYDGFALYIEPNYPNIMLMSTRDGGQGIMRSMDAGENWHSFHGAHDNYIPRGFVYGGVPGRVYSWGYHLLRRDNIHINE